MNDNLAQLIKNEQVDQSNHTLNLENQPTDIKKEVIKQVEVQSIITDSSSDEIEVIMLSKWFDENNINFDRVNTLKIRVRGVKPDERLLCSVLDPCNEIDEDGHPIRNLELIKDANIFPVLDLPGYDMDVYGNGFQIMYAFDEDIILKCYGIKTGLIIIFCLNINNQLIPYNRIKLKKKDSSITIVHPNREFIGNNINNTPLDLESFQIMYKQVQKELEKITDKQSAIDWLLDKQSYTRDINHLLQIDDVLTWMIS